MTAPARRLVFATRNPGKLAELRLLLADLGGAIDVLSADDLGLPDVVEDADTFLGNAAKKAREVGEACRLPALADDSGLEVDALGGAPGVVSARYAGPEQDDRRNNDKLLAALAGVPAERRTARFRSVLVLADPCGPLGERIASSEGVCEGLILAEPRGAGGFGYDPLFLLPELGRTAAELESDHKNRISHRGLALARLLELLERA